MHNPAHPGELLKSLCLEPLQLTVTQTAQALGVARKTLSEGYIADIPDLACCSAFGETAAIQDVIKAQKSITDV